MSRASWNSTILFFALAAASPCYPAPAAQDEPAEQAEKILAATGVQGGLVVHLGCGDGRLTAALRRNESYSVLGLDTDAANVAKARAFIQSRGLYGNVTVDRWQGGRLPLIDNLVNLLVAEGGPPASNEEILRVLAPRGAAYVRTNDGWNETVKPWPPELDEWTHFLHDATNNAVSQDTVVGPPRHYQWLGSPTYLRHHDHMSGFSAMVSAGGRVFYIIDLGPRWSVQMPPQWMLIARDAFNGTILWQRPIPKWHAHLWPLKKGPAQLMRRLVAVGDTVSVTPGVGSPVVALDAATGKVRRTFEGTEGAEEIILQGGVLFTLVDPTGDAFQTISRESVELTRGAGRDWNWDERPRRLMAIDQVSGLVLWEKTGRVAPSSLASMDGRVYFHDGDKVVCLNGADGNQVWNSKPLPRWSPMHVLFNPTLIVHGDVVLFAGGEKMTPISGGKDTMTALSAATGEVLWTAPHPQSGYASSEDLFVIDNLAWCGVTTNRRDSGIFTGRNLQTGEVAVEFPPDDWGHMPHHRCHRAKATANYILTSRTGIEYVDLGNQQWTAHHWVRGSCNYGIMPANGLTYAGPHSCACYPLAKLTGFNALAPKREIDDAVPNDADDERLQRGPAYRDTKTPSSAAGPQSGDWPTLRHDAARSGVASTSLPAELKTTWQASVGGKLGAPVIAEGRLFVTSIETHDVHALDAATGRPLWSFKAGGRIDSPPSVWQGRVLFGSADGFVYCLRAADGEIGWRFRAAPADLRMMAREQVESVWPVPGSVLVREGTVYCVAGRAMWLDGGLRMLRIDARTGRKLSETILDDKYPETGENLQTDVKWPNLPVALPDVLSCDGRYVYMRSQPFDLEGNRTEIVTPRSYEQQQGETTHLFCPSGFLDDTWWHRTYWIYGRSFIGGAGGWYLAAYQAPAGRILAVDDTNVYGFGRLASGFRGTQNIYHLFACDKQPELHNPNPKQAARKQGSSIYGKVIATHPVYHWSESIPFMTRALVLAEGALFAAGPAEIVDESEVYLRYGDQEIQAQMRQHVEAFEGRHGGILMAVSKQNGRKLSAYRLASIPVFDGMAAAEGRLYLSMLDGNVLCLGADGRPLDVAGDVEPGPVPVATRGFVETTSHPDFEHLKTVSVMSSDLGYRMQTAPKEVGLALRKLDTPLTKRAEFRVRVRPTPGAGIADKPGNAFVAFGDAPEDGGLVKCGLRISGKRLFIVQGPLLEGESKSLPADVKSDEVAEIQVVVDLAEQTVAMTMKGETLSVPLRQRMNAVSWVGCCLTGVTTDFSPVDVSGE